MRGRVVVAGLLGLIAWSEPSHAQRPKFGFGVGGGVVLGAELARHGFIVRSDGADREVVQQTDLNDVAVASGHAEWYPIPRLALRAHAARGSGRVRVVTTEGGETGAAVETDGGDVRISALDGGISLWPWAPGSAGFAPFVTVGVGSFTYDFEESEDGGPLQASGRRTERAFLIGVGADMSVWRSVMLRIEAVDHIAGSPLRSDDFARPADARDANADDDTVNNVRLVIGAHVYFPFGTVAAAERR